MRVISNIEKFFSIALVTFISIKAKNKKKRAAYRSYVFNFSKFHLRAGQGTRKGQDELIRRNETDG